MNQWLQERANRNDSIQKRRQVAITENTPDLVATIDIDGFLIHLNKAGYALLGLDENASLSGIRLISFYDRKSADAFIGSEMQKAIKFGASHTEIDLLNCEGKEIPGSQVLVAHKDSVGSIECFSVIVRDISSIREAEHERELLQEELHQTKKITTMGRLAGGVAHDFNNLITVIMGYAELAMLNSSKGLSDEAELKMILESAQKAARLSSQLLDFSSKQMIEPEVMNLNAVIESSRQLIESLLGESVEVDWQQDPDLWSIKIDQSQLEQIILNLTVNSRDAMEERGVFTIRTGNLSLSKKKANRLGLLEGGDYVLLSVTDTGCGIDAQHLEHIYEPFFTTKAKGKGTGLGLSAVFGAVKQNHGVIKVHSQPGHGTTFQIYFPRELVATDQQGLQADSKDCEKAGSAYESILLVEDNAEVRDLLSTILADSGYQVTAAENGAKALDAYENHKGAFDLIVSDVVMPVMNGMELYRELQKKNPDTRVILMSGHTDQMLVADELDSSRVNLISKPFPTAKFTETIRDALDSVVA